MNRLMSPSLMSWKGQHGHDAEGPARFEDDGNAAGAVHGFKAHGDAEALNDGDKNRAVARVLGDFTATCRTLFLGHALQLGADHLQELKDD